MRTFDASDRAALQGLKRRCFDFNAIVEQMRPIVSEVKENGDAALKRFAREFDGRELVSIRVSDERKTKAQVSETLKEALLLAKENILRFHARQMPQAWWMEIAPGIEAGQLVRPIERIGCYIPGGRYPLVSTVLMTVLPAKVAGVKEVIICTPKASPEILVACAIAGVDEIYEVGGGRRNCGDGLWHRKYPQSR